jgi:hypothetical protein
VGFGVLVRLAIDAIRAATARTRCRFRARSTGVPGMLDLGRMMFAPSSWPTRVLVAAAAPWLLATTACKRAPLDAEPYPAYAPLLPDGGAVFFVGNSFLGWQDRPLPQWVAALGAASTPPVRFDVGADIVFGDTPLAEFLDHPAMQAALASRRYDVFVLQGHELEPVDRQAEFHAAVREIDRAVVEAGGRTVLFMTWDFPFRRFIDELSASYDAIGRELRIPVIPAGLVYEDCRREPPPGLTPYFLTADAEHPEGDLHQNEKGTAVNTYTTFAVLTGRNPQGTMFEAPGNTNDATLMRSLSDRAWARVAPRLAPPER